MFNNLIKKQYDLDAGYSGFDFLPSSIIKMLYKSATLSIIGLFRIKKNDASWEISLDSGTSEKLGVVHARSEDFYISIMSGYKKSFPLKESADPDTFKEVFITCTPLYVSDNKEYCCGKFMLHVI